MAVRSRRLFGGQRLTVGAIQTIYTVPSGRTAILRKITLTNSSDTVAQPVTLRINGTTGGTLLFEDLVPGQTTVTLEDVVLNPGDILRGRSNLTGTTGIDIFGFGSLLEGEPS